MSSASRPAAFADHPSRDRGVARVLYSRSPSARRSADGPPAPARSRATPPFRFSEALQRPHGPVGVRAVRCSATRVRPAPATCGSRCRDEMRADDLQPLGRRSPCTKRRDEPRTHARDLGDPRWRRPACPQRCAGRRASRSSEEAPRAFDAQLRLQRPADSRDRVDHAAVVRARFHARPGVSRRSPSSARAWRSPAPTPGPSRRRQPPGRRLPRQPSVSDVAMSREQYRATSDAA